MLGRKAILHTARAGKRKWQVEQEKDSDAESSDDDEDVDAALDAALPGGASAGDPSSAPPEHGGGKAVEVRGGRVQAQKKNDEGHSKDEDDDEDEDGGGGGKTKRFAWMDSDDEVSDGDEEETVAKAPSFDMSFPPKPPALGALPGAAVKGPLPPKLLPAGAKALLALRAPLGGNHLALTLPPATALPALSQEHLALMAQIAAVRSLSDFWELLERRAQEFAAAHAALALHRLSALSAGDGAAAAVEKHKSFPRLRDRLDELLGTEKGRASFLSADLAMVAVSLAKVVPLPATEGATGRIFADIADEAESRILARPAAFTTSMLADLAWGISRSGNSKMCFLRTIVDASVPRLAEATCQDVATLAAAFVEHTFDEAEIVLHGVFQQAKQRLGYKPPSSGVAQPRLPVATSANTQAAVGLLPPAATLAAVDAAGVQAEGGGGEGRVSGVGSAAAVARAAEAAGVEEGRAAVGAPKNHLPAWQLVGHWRFNCAQISDVISAASRRVGLYDGLLFALVAQQFTPRVHEFNGQQLQKLREAFELMRHDVNGEFMRAVRSAQLLPRNRLDNGTASAAPPRLPANLLDPRKRTR